MKNRLYQTNALDAIDTGIEQGVYHQLISMATGTGKTHVFAQLKERLKATLPGQQLILAHREELIDQAVRKTQHLNPTLRVDKEKGKHHADPSISDIIVASVSTLGRKGTKRVFNYNWERVDKVVTDEAHHSIASSYMNIYEAGGYLIPGDKRLLLGMTATPQRGDGKALAQLYKKIVYVYSLRQAITEGWLVDIRGIKVQTKVSLDQVKTSEGDYDTKELANTVDIPVRNQQVAKAYLDYGEERQAIGFTVNIAHAQHLAEMFLHYGIAAEAIWGDDPERANKLARHRAGTTIVLFNCGVLTEGYDDWRIGCIILACPTKSAVKFTQMVGRGTRLEELEGGMVPNLLDWSGRPLKRDCIMLDVVDATSRNSLVTLPTLMGMAGSLNLKGGSLLGAIQRLEEAQAKYSHLDFSQLEDINSLESFIEQVDLFVVKFSPEVEGNSDFTWHNGASGGYILMLPKTEGDSQRNEIRITQNMLDKFEIKAYIKGKRYKGERDTIESVFQAADKLVQDICPEALKLVKREATWHNLPPTAGQLRLIVKFFRNKPLPSNLTRGQASALIGSKLAKRA